MLFCRMHCEFQTSCCISDILIIRAQSIGFVNNSKSSFVFLCGLWLCGECFLLDSPSASPHCECR